MPSSATCSSTSDGHPRSFFTTRNSSAWSGETGCVGDRTLVRNDRHSAGSTALQAIAPQTLDAFLDTDRRSGVFSRSSSSISQALKPRAGRTVAEALASYFGPTTVTNLSIRAITLIREYGFAGPRGIITYDYEGAEATRRGSPRTSATRCAISSTGTKPSSTLSPVTKVRLTLPAITFFGAPSASR